MWKWKYHIGSLPAWIKVSYGIYHITCHASKDGPFASQVPDDCGGDEHGGQDDRGEGDAVRGQAHAFISIQTALVHTENTAISFTFNRLEETN